MNRKKIQADYERRLDAKGKDTYIYTGPRFTIDLAPDKLLRYRVICWAAPLVGLLIFALMGLLDTDSTRAFYIALPFVALFMPLCLLLGDAYKVTAAKGSMERKDYARSVVQMKRCTIAWLAMAAYVTLAQIVFVIIGASSVPQAEWLFLLGAAVMDVLAFLFLSAQKRVPITEGR